MVVLAIATQFLWYHAIFLVRERGEKASFFAVPFQTFGRLYAVAQRENDPTERARLLRVRAAYYVCSAVFVICAIVFICLVALSVVRLVPQ